MSLITPYKKSFIPGPVHVTQETLRAMLEPTLPHRSPEFTRIYGECVEGLRKILSTEGRVYLSASSATGLMEAGIRNGVKTRVASFVCGAFSQRWADIVPACGKENDVYEVEWGEAVLPEVVETALASGKYDALTIVHNETSTGVINPIREISALVRKKYPEVMILVDCVSSMAAVALEPETWGLDMALAGSQKGFAVPPGLSLCTVSDRLMEKSKTLENKGAYFDFEAFEKHALNDQPPNTPAMPQIFALHHQVKKILNESMHTRLTRHKAMALKVQTWARKNFELFADAEYLSPTVTCIRNMQAEKLPTEKLLAAWKERGYLVAGGYGKLKGETFRIGHMGDITPNDVDELLKAGDEILEGV